MSREQLYIYDAHTCTQIGPVQTSGLDVFFPPHIHGWTDALDCREGTYLERTLEENCAFALRVRKNVIVVSQSQIAQEAPIPNS